MRVRFLVCAVCLATAIAVAQQERFGAGVIIGEPVGLSLKYHFNNVHAIDACIGYSFSGDNNFQIHSDFLWHNYEIFSGTNKNRLALYYGPGGRVKFGGDLRVGLRGPLGLSYTLPVAPVEVFVEAGPVFDLTPRFRFEFTAAVGARFLF